LQTTKELDFQTKKISKLVWDYALPGIVGTMVTGLYNVVGRIFIGQVEGALAISGLAITFPVMNLTSSLGMLVGAGAAARISISLGKRDKQTAEQILGNSLLLTVILNLVFITLFYIYLEPILMAFGASELTYPYARDYLQIVLLGNLFVSLCYNFNAMMRSSGYPKKAMYTMLIGAVLNIILSPVFLFVFDLGIKGVAWATVISMFIGMLFVMHHFTRKSSVIRLRWRNVRLNKKIILSMRDWGRDCWCESGVDNTCGCRFAKQHGTLPFGYDHKYVYSHFGYNLKATDMQAAVGCAQLDKLEMFTSRRKENFQILSTGLAEFKDIFYLPKPTPKSDPSWFGFMLTLKDGVSFTRNDITKHLEAHNIQTRNLFAGNITRHPCFMDLKEGIDFRIAEKLTVTDNIMSDSFWIGVYPGMKQEALQYMINTIRSFVTSTK